MQETPSYLVYSGQIKKAEESLYYLKGNLVDVPEELDTLQRNITRMKEQGKGCRSVLVPQLIKPVLLTSILMFFSRFSGAMAFNFYAVNIFSQVFGSFNPHLVAIINATVQLLTSMASGVLADKLGRKPLLLFSGLIMSASSFGFALYTYYCRDTCNSDILPLIIILIFQSSFSVGIQPMSWLLVGELFPLEFRAAGSSLTSSISYTFAFLGVKTFVDLNSSLGLHGTFLVYSAINMGGCFFTMFFLPETKQKPLKEMEPRGERLVTAV